MALTILILLVVSTIGLTVVYFLGSPKGMRVDSGNSDSMVSGSLETNETESRSDFQGTGGVGGRQRR